MGRGGRGGRGGKQRLMRKDYQGQGRRDNKWNENKTHRANEYLEAGDMHNEAFEEYYKVQDIVPEGEFQAFLDILKKPLPITFRINGSGRFANELREKLESDFFAQFSQGPVMLDDEVVDPPRPLPWYPNNLGWHMNFSRNQLRKLSWLAEIHEFMKVANEAGSITRQEAVSMVPPLFMDVQPHHRVLDMCAAPGSKTFQLLEMLHNMEGATAADGSGSNTPTGFVVANDADAQRCNLLTHQTKRMCSPCLMVTNHNGEMFPCITGLKAAPGSAAPAAAAVGGSSSEGEVMLFDRILCDVPCSGDGTMRKAPDIWRRWSVNNGNGLHTMQLKIALQAVRLLKVGGRLVYSTCTPNPIEDEAVVAELLLRCKGALELLDVSDKLPELKRCPGKRKWMVRDKHQWYATWEEAEKVGYKLDPTMFCNPDKEQLPLERCMRILPHHQDTGGFFVAVLQKVAATPDLPDPSLAHRYTRIINSGRDGRLIKIDGADPHQGAEDAAEYALAAADRAVAALESGDTAAATAAANAAAAAQARGGLAMDAATEIYKNQRRYDAQEARKQEKQQKHQQRLQQQQHDKQQRQQQGDAGAAAAEDMDGAETAAADEAAADLMDVDDTAAAATGDNDDPETLDETAVAAAAENGEEMDKAAATAADGETLDNAAATAGGDEKAAWTPSWVRGGGGRGRVNSGRFRGIDPIIPVQDPTIIKMLVDFYGVEPSFPLATHLITRSLEAALPKRLYYVADALLSVLLADVKESLKITATGLKIFERHELRGKEIGKCQYRIAQEGLPFLLPHLTKQVLRLPVADFLRLLTERNLPLLIPAQANGTSESEAAAAAAAAQTPSSQVPLATPSVLKQLEGMESGGAVAMLEEAAARELGLATDGASGALTVNAPLAISVWRTRASLSVLVAKNECEQLVEKIKGAQQRQAKQQQGKPAAAAKEAVKVAA